MLKEDLRVMRSAIDSYTMDKQKAPQSLDDLVQDGYLKVIPRRSDDQSRDIVGYGRERLAALAGPDRPGYRRRALRLTGDRIRRTALLHVVAREDKNGSENDWLVVAPVFCLCLVLRYSAEPTKTDHH